MSELPQKSMTLSEQLEQERKTLTESIKAKYGQIGHLESFIKWDKKRLKLVTDQLSELQGK